MLVHLGPKQPVAVVEIGGRTVVDATAAGFDSGSVVQVSVVGLYMAPSPKMLLPFQPPQTNMFVPTMATPCSRASRSAAVIAESNPSEAWPTVPVSLPAPRMVVASGVWARAGRLGSA